MKKILVLGSLNIDLVQRVPRLPVAGETLRAGGVEIFVGGKGANQAVAAALLGADVLMAGKVGADVFGMRLLEELKATGVDIAAVEKCHGPSGTAVIFVLPDGDNSITISAGANAKVDVAYALQAIEGLRAGDFLLCQLEIPMDSARAAILAAHKKHALTVLDPAPAAELPADIWPAISILTPNQTEAAILLRGSQPIEDFSQAEVAANELRSRGVGTVILKMAEMGCFVAAPEMLSPVPGFQVDARDTTGAGDAFNGALAAALARQLDLASAVRFAHAAAALSVTRPGAIASMPRLRAVENFLRQAGVPS